MTREKAAEKSGEAMSESILIVDDEKDTLQLLSRFFTVEGYEVVGVLSGAEALESARSRQFDLLITDLNMPQINGIQLTKEIRKLDTSHPIILGTHVEDLEIDTKFYPWIVGGVCDYLVVHGYSAYSKWVRTPLDSAMLPFLCILTESIGGKPIIVEEFGAPTLSGDSEKTIKDSQVYLATEDEQAWYFKETLQKKE